MPATPDVPTLTYDDRLKLNIRRSRDLITEAGQRGDLATDEVKQLKDALRKGEFDVQVALMGGAQQSAGLGDKLPGQLLPPLHLE